VDAEVVKRLGKWKGVDKEDRKLIARVLVLVGVLPSVGLNEKAELSSLWTCSLRGVGLSPIESRGIYSVLEWAGKS